MVAASPLQALASGTEASSRFVCRCLRSSFADDLELPLNGRLHYRAVGKLLRITIAYKLSNPQGRFVHVPEKGCRLTSHTEVVGRGRSPRGYMGYTGIKKHLDLGYFDWAAGRFTPGHLPT
jgi:hypothetical protein